MLHALTDCPKNCNRHVMNCLLNFDASKILSFDLSGQASGTSSRTAGGWRACCNIPGYQEQVPDPHGFYKTSAGGNLVRTCQIDISNLKPLKMYA